MYEELIGALKKCGYPGDVHYCRDCFLSDSGGTCRMKKLLPAAADAIEGLEKACEEAYNKGLLEGGIAQRAEDEKWLPKWIPVTERLPEEPYGCLAIVWDNPRYDGDMFLNYYPEFVGWDGETWNDADGEEIPFDVVYWMKMPQIPEPPKEGE